MRITLLVDAEFGLRERDMLVRLQVGLADEGLRVVFASPRSGSLVDAPESRSSSPDESQQSVGVIAVHAVYEDRGMPWTLDARAARLAETLAKSAPPRPEAPRGAIHVFGHRAWNLAVRLAQRTGDGLVIEFHSAALRRRLAHASSITALGPSVLIASPEPALARLVERERAGIATRVIPWGVPIPAEPRAILAGERAPAILLVASGRDREACAAAVEAFAAVNVPDAMLCIDADVLHVARLWPLIKRLNLTSRTTLIPNLESRRELAILGADIVIAPEARGESRSILLDAMAAGLPVIAGVDAALDSLIGGQTARLIAAPEPKLWTSAMAELLRDPEAARALGRTSRDAIRQHHRVSSQISLTLNAYEHLAGTLARVIET